MLTELDYNNLWTTPLTAGGFGKTTVAPPCYHDYLRREIYQQDYLDLFLGKPTHVRFRIDGEWCVNINELIITVNEYPWSKEQLNEDREIKYVMIGEAAPGSGCTYFYNTQHITPTKWLSAPWEAFYLRRFPAIRATSDKRIRLLDLAKRGYFLIDLFPYALSYNSRFRTRLAGPRNMVHYHFFKKITIVPKLISLAALGVCSENVKLAFSGPMIIHHDLARVIGPPPHVFLPVGITLDSIPNFFVPPGLVLPAVGNRTVEWPYGALLNGKAHLVRGDMDRSPYFKCSAYNPLKGSLYPPLELFIRNAFDLP